MLMFTVFFQQLLPHFFIYSIYMPFKRLRSLNFFTVILFFFCKENNFQKKMPTINLKFGIDVYNVTEDLDFK